jgi:hypothetical protein
MFLGLLTTMRNIVCAKQEGQMELNVGFATFKQA